MSMISSDGEVAGTKFFFVATVIGAVVLLLGSITAPAVPTAKSLNQVDNPAIEQVVVTAHSGKLS
ncbi:MAG TPA: hypothetical protein VFI93_13055 [Rhizomicrobium sp.]|nr:hypothetical protein [Rhizomicrobium sp.]